MYIISSKKNIHEKTVKVSKGKIKLPHELALKLNVSQGSKLIFSVDEGKFYVGNLGDNDFSYFTIGSNNTINSTTLAYYLGEEAEFEIGEGKQFVIENSEQTIKLDMIELIKKENDKQEKIENNNEQSNTTTSESTNPVLNQPASLQPTPTESAIDY